MVPCVSDKTLRINELYVAYVHPKRNLPGLSFAGIACTNGDHLVLINVEMKNVVEKILAFALSVKQNSKK